jgi:hypothetical protein
MSQTDEFWNLVWIQKCNSTTKAMWKKAKIDNRVEIDVKHILEWRTMLYER